MFYKFKQDCVWISETARVKIPSVSLCNFCTVFEAKTHHTHEHTPLNSPKAQQKKEDEDKKQKKQKPEAMPALIQCTGMLQMHKYAFKFGTFESILNSWSWS